MIERVRHPIARSAMRLSVLLLLPLLASSLAASGTDRPAITAVPVGTERMVVDGRLDEAIWSAAPAMSEFVQRQPVEGAAASEKTEVRFVYTPKALYIGARMFTSDPALIQAPVSRRDYPEQADFIAISLDTFLDRRTAYTFGVTAAGTRFDRYHAADRESSVDSTFEPVWRAEARIHEDGWTAEMEIPWSQLRFNRSDETHRAATSSSRSRRLHRLSRYRLDPRRGETHRETSHRHVDRFPVRRHRKRNREDVELR